MPALQRLAALFLILSGGAALIYQVAWVRLLGLSLGSTSGAVATVLAAFFTGLALGSYLARALIRRRPRRDLGLYLGLEALIGFSGWALLPILLGLDALMAQLGPIGASPPIRFAVTLGLLAVPTVCIGATFPLLASVLIRRRRELGALMGRLYALNTAGAVLGAGLAGFVLVPFAGLDGAVLVAVGSNLTIVAAGLGVVWRWREPEGEEIGAGPGPAEPGAEGERSAARFPALVVVFVTGLVSIAVEVGWTKYLAIFTGATIYGFSAILTVFLTGIALGSWAIQTRLDRIRRPLLWLVAGLLLLAAALAVTRSGLAAVPYLNEMLNRLALSEIPRLGLRFGAALVLVLAPTLLFGALFPLGLTLYCGDPRGVARRLGPAYALNTAAGILGSVAAGFWWIPRYGTDRLLQLTAVAVALLPLAFLGRLRRPGERAAATAGSALVALACLALPGIDFGRLIDSVDYRYDEDARAGRSPRLLFLREGRSAVISMVTYDGRLVKLQSNGLNEAALDREDRSRSYLVEALLGLAPFFLHPDPADAFVVGFGGGSTVASLAEAGLEEVRVVELEPAVVEAVGAVLGRRPPVLERPAVRLVYNDARNALLVEGRSYDLVVSQPSHPWTSGAGALFTREFFAIVRGRLRPGGFFGQWVNLFNMDAPTLRSILAAYYEVFPHGFVLGFTDTGDLLLIGSLSPIRFDFETVARRMSIPATAERLALHGVHGPVDLLYYFALSRAEALEAAAGSRPNSDTRLLSEVRLAALTPSLPPERDPHELLERHYGLDLVPYLEPGEAAARLREVALMFRERAAGGGLEAALARLREIDPALAAELE